MKVEMIKNPTQEDWNFVKVCALNTMGKKMVNEPDKTWKRKMLESEHSPIRSLWFAFRLEIPYWVSVHLVRHGIGCEHFVQSQRDDRNNNEIPREEKPQGEMVTHILYINAQELMFMARRRLCGKASVETRYVMSEIARLVIKSNPEFVGLLVPMCVYKGGHCSEFEPCGRWHRIDTADDDGK